MRTTACWFRRMIRNMFCGRVWLTKEEEQGYYYGFANEGLWPLCHIAHTRPLFPRQRLASIIRKSTANLPTRCWRRWRVSAVRSCWCRTITLRCYRE